MHTDENNCGSTHNMIGKSLLLVIAATAPLLPGWAAQEQTGAEEPSTTGQPDKIAPLTHMSETMRSSIKKIVVIAGESPAGQEITGSYEKETAGLLGGADAGSRVGTISKEVGGIPVSIPIPILTIPGAIFGGLSGAAKREIQEFRDALTKDLIQAADTPLTNEGLASDVYFGLRSVPGLNTKLIAPTTPVPDDTDAILYVSVNGVTIDVQGKDAILTTAAGVTLRRLSDGMFLYQAEVEYQDRDELGHWTENDNALWHDYANYARHYLGREFSAEVFDRIKLRHELRPRESETVDRVKRNDWQGVSRSTTPTLAWDLVLLGGDSYGSWTDAIDESNIFYDVELYDRHTLVYAEYQVSDPFHTLAYEIEPCKTYRWSVRPSYRVGDTIKFGEWMRSASGTETGAGGVRRLSGRQASEAPAYIQDFASLKIECGRK